jgi:GNAT superfamily N-acetyltransferase
MHSNVIAEQGGPSGEQNMIAIRLATLDDAGVIGRQTSGVQQLHNEALPTIFKPPSKDLFPPEKLAALIRDPNSIVAVAEMGGKVVGHIYGEVFTRAEDAFHQADSCLYIHQIGVDDDARRQRVGVALIAFVRDWARAMGLTALKLNHWAFNARARDFFEACGFSPMMVTMRQVLEDDPSS